MPLIEPCYSAHYGKVNITLTSSPANTVVVPAYLTSVRVSNNVQYNPYVVVLAQEESPTAPERVWGYIETEQGGILTLTGLFLKDAEPEGPGDNPQENLHILFEKFIHAVNSLYLTSITLTSAYADASTLTLNGCQAISSNVAAGSINGRTVHSGSISYYYETIA
jgi:hypothetical protein